jgi:hypothetical protein
MSQVPSKVTRHAVKVEKKLEILILQQPVIMFTSVGTMMYTGKVYKFSWLPVQAKMIFLCVEN